MFSGLRQGSFFYVLEKGDNINLKIGQVDSVSNPQPKYNQFTPSQPFNQPETVVDVRVRFGEEYIDFKQLPSSLSIANFGQNGVVVSENKDAMNSEVESMIRTSKGILDSIPYHEKVIQTCDVILRELNPQFAKEKEQEEKIGALEQKMGSIEGTLSDMMGMLSKALGKNASFKNKEE